jgi:hypothetical protein
LAAKNKTSTEAQKDSKVSRIVRIFDAEYSSWKSKYDDQEEGYRYLAGECHMLARIKRYEKQRH